MEMKLLYDTDLVFPSVLCSMFRGWTVRQSRNVGGSIVQVAGRGATFHAALDRDCGAGPLPPSDPSSQ